MALQYLGFGVPTLFHGVVHAHGGIVDQLHQVLVPGNHHDLKAGLLGVLHITCDDIIGFQAGNSKGRNAQSLGDGFDPWDLFFQIGGNFWAGALVFSEYFLAKRRSRAVQRHGEKVGIELLSGFQQHVRVAKERVGAHALGIGQRTNRMVRPKHEPKTIHQTENGRFTSHDASPMGPEYNTS